MKKTKLTRSLLAACSIVALSAVMYGCAHTDSGPSQEELDVALADKATAETDAAAAEEKAAAEAAARIEAEELAAAETAARIEAEEQAAADDAARIEAEELAAAETAARIEAEELAAADAAARIEAEELAAAETAARIEAEELAAAAEADEDAAQMEADRLQGATDAADAAAAKAMAQALHSGIMDGEMAIGQPMITATDGMPATSEATFFTIQNDPSNVGGDVEPAFAVAEMGMADEIDGWTGTLLMRSDIDHTDTMTVYNDIDALTGTPFSEVYNTVSGRLVFGDTATDGEVTPTANPSIVSDAFTNTNVVAHTFNSSSPGAAVPDYVAFSGSYHGAMGSYQCSTPGTPSGCTSTRNTNGSVTLTGNWTFTPTPGAMVMVPDSTYTHFGWWLRENKNPLEDTGSLAVQTFSGSSGAAFGAVVGLIGEASFEGKAAGKYALNDALTDTAEGGHFTADAELSVDFDDGTEPGTIEGEITNFSVGDGSWSVALRSTPMDDDAPHFNTGEDTETAITPAMAGTGTAWTIGERTEAAAGDWSGTFYMATNAASRRNDGTPSDAAGEFSAQFGDVGRMVGAFGADNVTADTPQ